MTSILIIAQHEDGTLNPATAKTLSGALQVGAEAIDIAVFAEPGSVVAGQAAKLDGVRRVVAVEDAAFKHPTAARLAPEIAALATDYSHVFGPSTTFGKDLMPRAAALLGVNQVSDIQQVIDARTFKRPIYAGNAIVTVRVPDEAIVVATIRSASFAAAPEGGDAAEIDARPAAAEDPGHTRYVRLESGGGDGPDLQTADRVVSGGRALGSAENFQLIYGFAEKMGAAVGASRAAVDAGYVPNELQVGQTGKIIAPELYFAIGISGAIQHLTGIKDAGTIVAINKDAEAPIFEIADYGLVGDLFDVIPELEKLV
ncbi:electron transfer flavoprotein subunit alpha/FixB family protein [Wenzhouxiangella sp. XN79A]|uniref:electron transfer flavoprotein subunit alpha/FixB family protein n=1 Tax=Wenzhouxiangella sp. XN79A TaxID=2724193 RepID=UPI00144AA829|nr:FAD-binding protein [Wenzhouxiangella sp. XN79A]NKI34201.1 electron transfer flavoprotein subunit alpha/FixB family protein [Wenzhouxiangella sp. XN79A]